MRLSADIVDLQRMNRYDFGSPLPLHLHNLIAMEFTEHINAPMGINRF